MTEMRKWSLGTLVLVLVLVVGAWFLLISPKRSEAADLQAQTVAQQDANAQLTTQIAALKVQSKDLPKKQAQLAELNAKIPADASLPTLIRELSQSAQKAGVDLTEITPSTPAPLTPDTTTATVSPGAGNLVQITLNMTASGGYFELQQFFSQLERMQRAVLVTGATISEADSSSSTGTSGSETSTTSTSQLTATITAQVFVATPVALDANGAGSTTGSTTDSSTDTSTEPSTATTTQ